MCYISCSVTSDSLWPHGLYSPLGSSIHGILQGRILEWVAIPFFRGSSWPRDQTRVLAQLVKNLQQCRRPWFDSWVRKIPWRRDRLPTPVSLGFPRGSDGKVSNCNAGDLGLISWRREQLTTPVLWPGEFHGQRSLAGYIQSMGLQRVGHNWVTFTFFLSCRAGRFFTVWSTREAPMCCLRLSSLHPSGSLPLLSLPVIWQTYQWLITGCQGLTE